MASATTHLPGPLVDAATRDREKFEQEHGSHGVTTLLTEHLCDAGAGVALEFPAKGGQLASVAVSDEDVVRGASSGRGRAHHAARGHTHVRLTRG